MATVAFNVSVLLITDSVILPQMHFICSCCSIPPSCLDTTSLLWKIQKYIKYTKIKETKMHFICSRRRIPPSCLGSERLGKGIGRAYSNWHLTSHLAFQNHKNDKNTKIQQNKNTNKDLERGIGRANSNWRSSHFLLIIDHHVFITVNS